MFKKLVDLFTNSPQDVQVWKCDPLLVTVADDQVVYALKTDIEFTPVDSTEVIGKAIALTPNNEGLKPEITVISRIYIDAPSPTPDFGRRQGIVLSGTDLTGEPVSWHINGAADHFLTESKIDLEYDEEISKELESELGGELKKTNISTIL